MVETNAERSQTDDSVAQSTRLLQQSSSAQGLRAAVRAWISGYVDSYGLLHFGVFTSFMSGNTTSVGLQAGQAKYLAAGHSLLPIPFFVLGIFVATLLTQTGSRHPVQRLSILAAVILLLGVAAAFFAWPGWLDIIILSTAMGILNTSISQVGGESVNVGFVTGDLSRMARHVAMGMQGAPVQQSLGRWDTHGWRAAQLAMVWSSFLLGAVLGALVAPYLAVWTLLVPAVVLLIFA